MAHGTLLVIVTPDVNDLRGARDRALAPFKIEDGDGHYYGWDYLLHIDDPEWYVCDDELRAELERTNQAYNTMLEAASF